MKNFYHLMIERKNFLLFTLLPTFLLKLVSSFGVIVFNVSILFLTDKNSLGLFTIGLSIITFTTIISRIGLNGAILRFTSITIHQRKSNQFKNEIIFSFLFTLFLSLIIIIFIFLFEDIIVSSIYKNQDLRKLLFIFSLSIPLYSILLIQKSLLNSFRYSQLVSLCDIGTVLLITTLISIIAELIIGINLTIYRLSIYFLISNLILIISISLILLNLILSRFVTIFENNKFNLDKIFVRSLPNYFIIDLSNYFLIWGSIFLASIILIPSDLAVFSTIFVLALSINFVPITLNSIFAPMISIKFHKKDYNGLFKTIFNYRILSIFITTPIILLLFIFSEEILLLIFDEVSSFYINTFRIFILSHCFKIFSGPLILLFNLIGKEKIVRNISIVTLFSHLLLVITLVSWFNIYFQAIAISYIFTLFIKYLILNISYFNFKKSIIK